MTGDDALTTFRRAIAEWKLGRKPIEDLPSAAVEALAAGVDTSTLAQLAGLEGASWSEIQPFAQRVTEEIGGVESEQDAKLLVADAWLSRVAAGRPYPAGHDNDSLTEQILLGLGGEYEWFRLAIYDLEYLDAISDHAGRERAVEEMRGRARQTLSRPVAVRLAAVAPTLDQRPFISQRPVKPSPLRRLLRRGDH